GPMVHTAIQQFFRDVIWGELDYLFVDLPPGTGDAQLTISQIVPLCGAITVTTPQEVALHDVRKGMMMFQKVNVPLLGIVENMSYYVCAHCGTRSEIFSHGGGERAAEKLGIPFLGRIPIDPAIRAGG
ncbi:MAG: ATP-binding protein, partial [Nitrospiraceae bacterium]